jgi:GH18 family chitinase
LDAASAADGRASNKYIITAATPASDYGLRYMDLSAVHKFFDFFNVMTYEMHLNNKTSFKPILLFA